MSPCRSYRRSTSKEAMYSSIDENKLNNAALLFSDVCVTMHSTGWTRGDIAFMLSNPLATHTSPHGECVLLQTGNFGCRRVGCDSPPINVEGISNTKLQAIHHLAMTHEASAILLQETHSTNPSLLYLPGYTPAAHTTSSIYSLATFICESIGWDNVASVKDDIEWTWRELPSQMCMNHLGANSVLTYCPTTHNHVPNLDISTATAPLGYYPRNNPAAIPWKTGPPSQTCHFFMIPSSFPASGQADGEPTPTLT